LSESLNAIGKDPTRVIEKANLLETRDALVTATNEVRQLGIFGSPSFVAKGEVFWGDDRLEDAIQWLRHGTLAG